MIILKYCCIGINLALMHFSLMQRNIFLLIGWQSINELFIGYRNRGWCMHSWENWLDNCWKRKYDSWIYFFPDIIMYELIKLWSYVIFWINWGTFLGWWVKRKVESIVFSLIVNISYKSLCNTEITISIDCKENLINNLWCNLYSSIECCIAVNVPV